MAVRGAPVAPGRVHRRQAGVAAAADPATRIRSVDGGAAHAGARPRLPGPGSRLGRCARSSDMGRRAARPARIRAAGGPVRGEHPRHRAGRAAEHRRRRARGLATRDRDHGPPRQHRPGPRRERQRVRDGSADRARTRLRPRGGNDDPAGAALEHARLRVDRRRRLRSARRGAVRRQLAVPGRRAGRAQPRRRRRARRAPAGHRRRHRPFAGSGARPYRSGAHPGADRQRAGASVGLRAAAAARLPFHARRARALRRPAACRH